MPFVRTCAILLRKLGICGLLTVLVAGGADCKQGRGIKDSARADGGADAATDRAPASPDANRDGVLLPQDGPPATLDAPLVTGTGETGRPCLAGGECKTGFCADSVCCDAACTGTCLACSEASTGLPNGTCGPAKAGLNPHDSCAASVPETCGNDGTCDGAGACRKFGTNQLCADAICSGTMFAAARTCDGKGACGAASPLDCGAFPCTSVGCAKPCTSDGDCGAQSYCLVSQSQCKAKRLNGDACTVKGECTSGLCVDGVCCQTACTGACVSCAEADTGQKSGTCQPVAAGKDPADDCPIDPPAMCGRDGTCDGKGGCRKYDAATKCAEGTCSGTIFNPPKSCSNGACVAATSTDCKQAACTASGCQTACSKDTECAASAYCVGATCTVRKSNGQTCAAGNECLSTACVDGVCCDSACSGLCSACSNAKTGQTNGKCSPITAGADPDNECTAAAKTTCALEGSCDGAGACRKWGTGTECVSGMCNAAGNFVSARTCDGLGTCGAATTEICAPNICAATGCVGTCTKDSDCVGNNYCAAGGRCTAKKSQGGGCGGVNECQSGFCAQGVCCNNACNGICVSCLAADNGMTSSGTCANVAAGKDPYNQCAAGTSTCGLDGMCGGGKCRFAASGTSCAGAVCTNGPNNASATLFAAKSCDGNGNCPSGTSSTCPGNVLCGSASACKSSTCVTDDDCIAGYYCGAPGTCKARGANGAACSGSTSGNQCTSNNCSSDGTCCATACAATCQGCNVSNTGMNSGTCGLRLSNMTTCNGNCPPGRIICFDSCVVASWTFNSTAEGWFYSDIDREFDIEVVHTSAATHTSGGGALSVRLRSNFDFGHPMTVGVQVGCDTSTTINLTGRTLSAWVRRSITSTETTTCSFGKGGLPENWGTITVPTDTNWHQMTATVPSTSADISFDISCTSPTYDWGGAMYIDDVTIR